MTNEKETVVLTAQEGTVTGSQAASQPVGGQPSELAEGERYLSAAQPAGQPGTAPVLDGDDVEYEPMNYPDPGAVTEQFDHLATRDPEQMMEVASGDPTAEHLEPATISTEAAALAGGNEISYDNRKGAVTRVQSDNYDLADSPERER